MTHIRYSSVLNKLCVVEEQTLKTHVQSYCFRKYANASMFMRVLALRSVKDKDNHVHCMITHICQSRFSCW